MHCVRCGQSTDDLPCSACGDAPRLHDRYRLLDLVGQGAHGTTWRALDDDTGQVRAIKELPLRLGASPKTVELFRREAHVLQQLSHDNLPACHTAFETGTGRQHTLWIVMDFIEGQTLDREMQTRRYGESEVLDIAENLLQTLEYLHGRSPPVVHRDLKPGNVIRTPDGRLVLVDFGSVRDALGDRDLGGSTVAGTFGFMAPEQFAGDAEPRTDLYGIGALVTALLTRKAPHTLQDAHGRLQWREAASLSPAAGTWLDRMIAAETEHRPASASAALAELRDARRRPQHTSQPTADSAPFPRDDTSDEVARPGTISLPDERAGGGRLVVAGSCRRALDPERDGELEALIADSLGIDGEWRRVGRTAHWQSTSASGRSVKITFHSQSGGTRISASEALGGMWGGLLGGLGGGIGGGVGGGVGWMVFLERGPVAGVVFLATIAGAALFLGLGLGLRVQRQRKRQLDAVVDDLQNRLGGAVVPRKSARPAGHWLPIALAGVCAALAISTFIPTIGFEGPGFWPMFGLLFLVFGLGKNEREPRRTSHRTARREEREHRRRRKRPKQIRKQASFEEDMHEVADEIAEAGEEVHRELKRAAREVRETFGGGGKR